MKKNSLYFALALFVMANGFGQSVHYDIEISEPDTQGILSVDVYNASIEVIGTDKKHVQLDIIDERKGKDKKFGSAEFLYQIHEDKNIVTIINRKSQKKRVEGLTLRFKVPSNFSIKLETYYGKIVSVSGIRGQIEVNGYYTDIIVDNIENNIVASTNDGLLKATFLKILNSGIYYLSNYNGDTEILLPEETKATIYMDNYFGKYKSDFKLTLGTPGNTLYKKYIVRQLNGGGAKFQLANYYGDIFLKAKF